MKKTGEVTDYADWILPFNKNVIPGYNKLVAKMHTCNMPVEFWQATVSPQPKPAGWKFREIGKLKWCKDCSMHHFHLW